MASRITVTQAVKEAPEPKALQPTSTKALATEDIFTEFDRIYDSIARRAFEIFSGDGHGFGHDLEHWFKAEAELLHPIHTRITESDKALTVKAEVPGFNARELDVSLEPRRLTISGKKETSKEDKRKEKTVYQEQCSSEILRIIDLPAEVDAAKTTAILNNGVLELTLPRAAQTISARVEVKAA